MLANVLEHLKIFETFENLKQSAKSVQRLYDTHHMNCVIFVSLLS